MEDRFVMRILLLACLAVGLFGCSNDRSKQTAGNDFAKIINLREHIGKEFNEALECALAEYKKLYREEILLLEPLSNFLYPVPVSISNQNAPSLVKPLYATIQGLCGQTESFFTPLVAVIAFDYPRELKRIHIQNHGEVNFWGILPKDESPEVPNSFLLVVQRANTEGESGYIRARCAFLLRIRCDHEVSLAWIGCKAVFKGDKSGWIIEHSWKLEPGEQLF